MKRINLYVIFGLFLNLKTVNDDFKKTDNNLKFSNKKELDLLIYNNWELVLDICKEDTENKIYPKEQRIILNYLANQQKKKNENANENWIRHYKEEKFNQKMQIFLILGSGLIGVGLFCYIIKKIFNFIKIKIKKEKINNTEEIQIIKN